MLLVGVTFTSSVSTKCVGYYDGS